MAAQDSRRKRIRGWLFIIFFLFIFIIGCVALLELYSAYKYYKFRDTLRADIRVMRLKEHSRNLSATARNANGEQVRFRTDDNAFIQPSAIHAEPDLKIAFLGGSTTECYEVREDTRFPYLVGRMLEEETGLKINAYNAGVSGNNSMHTINILNNKVLPIKPHIAFFMHNINDVSTLKNTGTYWNDNLSRSQIVDNTDGLINYKVRLPKNWFVRTFIPYISLVLLPTTFENEEWLEPIDEWEGYELSDEFPDSVVSKDFVSTMKTFVNTCRAWDVKPVLMTQAENFDDDIGENSDTAFVMIRQRTFNDLIRETAANNEVLLVDLDSALSGNSQYFQDFVHFNESGSERVAELIFHALYPEIEKLPAQLP